MKSNRKTSAISSDAQPLCDISQGCEASAKTQRKKPQRLQARAIKRILSRRSGEHVGWLYEWNTGALVPRWKSEVCYDVIYK